jgi:Pyruvate/2-oxoacid:ferredoxin oxidoreductase delta subunit
MGKTVRQMIKIDEELCNGCGLCVTACAEGALQIVDGKARMVSDQYCDGLGACLGECPQGAISFETREAEEFDEAATVKRLEAMGISPERHFAHMAEHGIGGHAEQGRAQHPGGHEHGHGGFVCPSARVIDRTNEAPQRTQPLTTEVPSELRQWPVKLYLVNPNAPYFRDADLLVAADCVPFALGSFHPELLRGRILVTGCPKFDETSVYLEKLTEIFAQNDIRTVTVAMMEVPCCSGMLRLVHSAVEASGKNVPVESVVVGLDGQAISRTRFA